MDKFIKCEEIIIVKANKTLSVYCPFKQGKNK